MFRKIIFSYYNLIELDVRNIVIVGCTYFRNFRKNVSHHHEKVQFLIQNIHLLVIKASEIVRQKFYVISFATFLINLLNIVHGSSITVRHAQLWRFNYESSNKQA